MRDPGPIEAHERDGSSRNERKINGVQRDSENSTETAASRANEKSWTGRKKATSIRSDPAGIGRDQACEHEGVRASERMVDEPESNRENLAGNEDE